MDTDSTIPLPKTVQACRKALLNWYDGHARDLPWRVLPVARSQGQRPDPYGVWLSEIMLQQTSVTAVKGYYATFLDRWPGVEHLAAAPLEEVLINWAGLGYYARARNLHACAQRVVDQHGGVFPQTEVELRTLPGIGDYTAAAIAAIVHGLPTNVVDGNVERVMARLHRVERPLPDAKPVLKSLAAHYVFPHRAADWPQALMDLGASICRPKNPKCDLCPLDRHCLATKTGKPDAYPRRQPKAARPVRYGAAFVLCRDDTVLLRSRPAKGLLGGMSEVPNSAWQEKGETKEIMMMSAPVETNWHNVGSVRHVFTHFVLELDIYKGQASKEYQTNEGWWASCHKLDEEALPSLMRKVLAQAGMVLK